MHLRVDAAKSIIPYIYPKLSNVDVHSRDGQPLVVQILKFSADAPAERNERLAAPPVIDLTADASTEAVEAVAEVVIEATADGEEER